MRAWTALFLGVVLMAPAFAKGQAEGLRPATDAAGVSLGVAIRYDMLEDEAYVRTVKENFNLLVPENDLKWEMIRLSPTKFDFAAVDLLVDFAEENHMAFRGHTLVWHEQNPSWLGRLPDDAAWRQALTDHITTVVGHYQGRIRDWDVVNEVVEADGTLRDTPWLRHLGPDYIAQAFRLARQSDPAAKLFINDYGAEFPGPKADGLYALVKGLLAQGVPVDGVGFQAHLINGPVDFDALKANFQRFKDLGLAVEITEIDVRIPGALTPEKLAQQADAFAGFLRVLREGGFGSTYVVWGVSDMRSWVNMRFPGFGAPLLFDDDYRAKPAVDALRRELKRR